ncbi:MAG: elongation factor P maturation arginine rhamnosyltransferase EarP [Pseudomonadota bacterium]
MHATTPLSLALFCKVVDNYGDIGICWRLARQLRIEHGIAVTLWVDDLRSFARLCPAIECGADLQQLDGVTVRHWRDQHGVFAPSDVADIVIEFFAVDIPPGYVEAMAQCTPRPVWLNLEGLTAEEWVEGCHRLPSMHPRLPLTKHFFFPGFTARTGGLLREAALTRQRVQFQSDPAAMAAELAQYGVSAQDMAATKVSLFCYPSAPLAALLDAWRGADAPVLCLVPEGVASDAVAAFLGVDARAGALRSEGALTLRVIPFVAQPDYDRLLWACDLNFVRGEDSFVRAQWAGRPFVWHIYEQDEKLHHVKLRAFLQRYGAPGEAWAALSLCWNGASGEAGDWPALWRGLRAELPALAGHASAWELQMAALGDLAGNLRMFADSLMQPNAGESSKTPV